jgi:hypothetical protein
LDKWGQAVLEGGGCHRRGSRLPLVSGIGQQSGRQDSNSVGLRSQDLLQSWAHGLRLQGGRGVGAHSARLRGPRIVVPPGLELGLWRRDLWLHVGLSSAYRVGDCRVGFYLRLWLKEKENYLIFYFYFYFLR